MRGDERGGVIGQDNLRLIVVEHIRKRGGHEEDTPCVLGAIVLFTVVFSMVNLVVDIIYAFVDPRIKAQYK